MINYKQEQIVIIGLGITGLSCIYFFRKRGVIPKVMDTRLSPPGLMKLPSDIPCTLGELNQKWLRNATLIVISPGISKQYLNTNLLTGIEIISDIELFAREAKEPIIAITGSNGKSTVTKLVSEIAINAGMKVGCGGNIGIPALTLLNQNNQLYVLELSSFQLENTNNLKPTAATILNISEDHMDRYPFGLKQYLAAKMKIYRHAKICVVNAQDSLTQPRYKNKVCISFGENYGDYHLSKRNNEIWLMANQKYLINCNEMHIKGHHNYINALAAIALVNIIGFSYSIIVKTLKKFRGLKYRFELVHEQYGVRWINDSKATNVGSTKAALNALKISGKLHLLLGGDSKCANFSTLLPYLQNKQVYPYCFGKDRNKLASLCPYTVCTSETLEQAMFIVSKRTNTGDIVLLSPACSSLDQFDNFEARGEIFSKLAKELG